MAAALQAQVDDALVVDAVELHLAGVRAELRHDRLDRALDPGRDRQRVQVMQQQQAFHQRIAGQLTHQPLAGLRVRTDDLDDLGQPGAVQIDQAAHELFRGGRDLRPGLRPQLGEQRFDPLARLLRVVACGHQPSLSLRPAGAYGPTWPGSHPWANAPC